MRMRGPGSTPRAMASRSSLSPAAPTLCTVVKPLISVDHAFSARIERHLRRRLALVLRAAVLAEVIADVDVHVDEARQQRDIAEVVGDRARCADRP